MINTMPSQLVIGLAVLVLIVILVIVYRKRSAAAVSKKPTGVVSASTLSHTTGTTPVGGNAYKQYLTGYCPGANSAPNILSTSTATDALDLCASIPSCTGVQASQSLTEPSWFACLKSNTPSQTPPTNTPSLGAGVWMLDPYTSVPPTPVGAPPPPTTLVGTSGPMAGYNQNYPSKHYANGYCAQNTAPFMFTQGDSYYAMTACADFMPGCTGVQKVQTPPTGYTAWTSCVNSNVPVSTPPANSTVSPGVWMIYPPAATAS